ncbi:trypsin-like serine protease [Cohnella sp. CFH 77786]|nr:trypsin-like serine protease [Cohnella sp. CFH 77786]
MKSLFAAFMAGALAIGGLTYASDRLEGFGGSAKATTGSASGGSAGTPVTASVGTAAAAGSVAEIAKQAGPAVVKIETEAVTGRRFSPRFGGSGTDGGGARSTGIGSGFFIDPSGYILTNEHVVSGADRIQVIVQGYDQPFTARLVGSSRELDLAVLKIEGNAPFSTLKLGDSNAVGIGDQVVAIGNPYDFDFSVTAGIISSKNREISISDDRGTIDYKGLLQTDTAINPGNSGGPLLNGRGEAIGMNTAVSSQAQRIGFAISSQTIRSVLPYLMHNQPIPATVSAHLAKGGQGA